jgi:O-6-methylguanine DNA methyltransferase
LATKTFDCDLDLIVEVQLSQGLIERVTLKPGKPKSRLICKLSSSNKIDSTIRDQIFAWLENYTRKKSPAGKLPLKPLPQKLFASKALSELKKIPFGSKKSYQEIARLSGNPRASRAVGNACASNPYPLFIPCHRVIRSDGTLGGFAYDLKLKEALLSFESSAAR